MRVQKGKICPVNWLMRVQKYMYIHVPLTQSCKKLTIIQKWQKICPVIWLMSEKSIHKYMYHNNEKIVLSVNEMPPKLNCFIHEGINKVSSKLFYLLVRVQKKH